MTAKVLAKTKLLLREKICCLWKNAQILPPMLILEKFPYSRTPRGCLLYISHCPFVTEKFLAESSDLRGRGKIP